VNHRPGCGVGCVSGVKRSAAWDFAGVNLSLTLSSVGRALCRLIRWFPSSPVLAQFARS
jgi:hypothetical protein